MPGLEIAPTFRPVEEYEQLTAEPTPALPTQAVVTGLVGYLKKCWQAARDTKMNGVEKRMMAAKRMLRGEYDTDKKTKIAAMGGSDIYMRLGDEKSTAAKAWLKDVILPADEEPFGIDSTPIPTLPDDMRDRIRQLAEQHLQENLRLSMVVDPIELEAEMLNLETEVYNKMREIVKETETAIEAKVKDVLVEADWRKAIGDFIDDLVDYPCGFLKGPFFRQKKKISREGQVPVAADVTCIDFSAPSAFNIYPSPSSRDIDDGFLIEKHSLRRRALVNMKGAPGYSDDAIDAVLEEYGVGGLRKWLWETNESEINRLSDRPDVTRDPDQTIDALQFWGSVQGMHLLEYGMSAEDIDGDVFGEFEVEAWLIGSHVIKMVLNEDPMGRRPYHKASYRSRKDQFWGDGVLDLIKDIQDMCNAAARNLVNNMGITSGPQIGVDTDAMPAGEAITSITPMKIWQFKMKDVLSGTRPPIWFFQPDSMVNEFIRVYEYFAAEADHKTGIPKYAYSNKGSSGGAADTATGFSMMMNNTSRLFKQVIRNIDWVIVASVQMVHDYLLLNDEDPVWMKADCRAVAKGTSSLINKEVAQVRRNEFLQILSSSEVAMAIVGKEGFAEILRSVASGLDLGRGKVVPTRDEMAREAFAMQHLQQSGMVPGAPMLPAPAQGVGNAPQVNGAGQRQGGADFAVT